VESCVPAAEAAHHPVLEEHLAMLDRSSDSQRTFQLRDRESLEDVRQLDLLEVAPDRDLLPLGTDSFAFRRTGTGLLVEQEVQFLRLEQPMLSGHES